jgi:hypothetical protein
MTKMAITQANIGRFMKKRGIVRLLVSYETCPLSLRERVRVRGIAGSFNASAPSSGLRPPSL